MLGLSGGDDQVRWVNKKGGPSLMTGQLLTLHQSQHVSWLLTRCAPGGPPSTKAQMIAEKELDEVLASSYGIFSGKATKTAVLRFTPERWRWVAAEVWHPNQKSRIEPDGFYVLEVPYSDDRELVLDILRHGSAIEVVRPDELRRKVRGDHLCAADYYG